MMFSCCRISFGNGIRIENQDAKLSNLVAATGTKTLILGKVPNLPAKMEFNFLINLFKFNG